MIGFSVLRLNRSVTLVNFLTLSEQSLSFLSCTLEILIFML